MNTVTMATPFRTITELREKLDEVHTFIHKEVPADRVDVMELRAGFDVAYARCGALLNRSADVAFDDVVASVSYFIAHDRSLCEPSRVWLADVLAGDDIEESFIRRGVRMSREWQYPL